jgi:hypothetical protein
LTGQPDRRIYWPVDIPDSGPAEYRHGTDERAFSRFMEVAAEMYLFAKKLVARLSPLAAG